MENINKKIPNSILLLVGDGDLRSAVEEKVRNLGLSENIKFLGVREDISNLMNAMDLFLFPSLFEGLPVVLIEAQAAGLNCIVSDSITKESDVTGRLEFISLQNSPDYWANIILSKTYEHYDTSKLLRESGYDTNSMASWLENYYLMEAK